VPADVDRIELMLPWVRSRLPRPIDLRPGSQQRAGRRGDRGCGDVSYAASPAGGPWTRRRGRAPVAGIELQMDKAAPTGLKNAVVTVARGAAMRSARGLRRMRDLKGWGSSMRAA